MKNHANDLLTVIDEDIASGRLEVYTDQKLKSQDVFSIFERNVYENKLLYGPGVVITV